jgi:hypothetical protein
MRILATFFLILSAVYCFGQPTKRIALVIGNNEYKSNPLTNPVNDAELIAETLDSLGFEVSLKRNLDRDALFESIRSFVRQLDESSVELGFLYYAGHGLQFNDRNYLVPTNASLTDPDQIEQYCVPTDIINRNRKQGQNTLITVLDACRSYPMGATRGTNTNGLAMSPTVTGTFTAYSTQVGSVAYDGNTNTNSPYSKALAKNLKIPNLTIEEIFKNVRSEVVDGTEGKQNPREESGLVGGKLYLNFDSKLAVIELEQMETKLKSLQNELYKADTLDKVAADKLLELQDALILQYSQFNDDASTLMSIELQLEKCNTAFRIFRQINDWSTDEYNHYETGYRTMVSSSLTSAYNSYLKQPELAQQNHSLYTRTVLNLAYAIWTDELDIDTSEFRIINLLKGLTIKDGSEEFKATYRKVLEELIQNKNQDASNNWEIYLTMCQSLNAASVNSNQHNIYNDLFKDLILFLPGEIETYIITTLDDLNSNEEIKKFNSQLMSDLDIFIGLSKNLNLSMAEKKELIKVYSGIISALTGYNADVVSNFQIDENSTFAASQFEELLTVCTPKDSVGILSDYAHILGNYMGICSKEKAQSTWQKSISISKLLLQSKQTQQIDKVYSIYGVLFDFRRAKELGLEISTLDLDFFRNTLDDLFKNFNAISSEYLRSDRLNFYRNSFYLLLAEIESLTKEETEEPNEYAKKLYNISWTFYSRDPEIGPISKEMAEVEISYANHLLQKESREYRNHFQEAIDIAEQLANQEEDVKQKVELASTIYQSVIESFAYRQFNWYTTKDFAEDVNFVEQAHNFNQTHKSILDSLNPILFFENSVRFNQIFLNDLNQNVVQRDSIIMSTIETIKAIVTKYSWSEIDSMSNKLIFVNTLGLCFKEMMNEGVNPQSFEGLNSWVKNYFIPKCDVVALSDFSPYFEGLMNYYGKQGRTNEAQNEAVSYINKLKKGMNQKDVSSFDRFYIQSNISYFYVLAGSYANKESKKIIEDGLSFNVNLLKLLSLKNDFETDFNADEITEAISSIHLNQFELQNLKTEYSESLVSLNEALGKVETLKDAKSKKDNKLQIFSRLIIANLALKDTFAAQHAYLQKLQIEKIVPQSDSVFHSLHTQELTIGSTNVQYAYFNFSTPQDSYPVLEIDVNRNGTVESDNDIRFYFDEQDSMHVEHVKELARYVGGLQYNEIGVNTSTSDSIKTVFYDNLPVSNIAAFGYKTGSNTYTVAVPTQSISNDNKGCNYLISYTYKNNYPYSWVVAKRYERTFYPLQANFNGFGSCYIHNFNE